MNEIQAVQGVWDEYRAFFKEQVRNKRPRNPASSRGIACVSNGQGFRRQESRCLANSTEHPNVLHGGE